MAIHQKSSSPEVAITPIHQDRIRKEQTLQAANDLATTTQTEGLLLF